MPTKRFDFAARIPLFPPFTTLDLREQASRSTSMEPSSTIGIRSTGIGNDGMIWEGICLNLQINTDHHHWLQLEDDDALMLM